METNIPYAEHNYETVGGCDKIKSGCQNCYAIPLIHRMNCCQKKKGRYKGLVKDGNWTGKIKLFEDRVEQPLHRHIPTTYFVNSRSDTFRKGVPFEFLDKMFAVMEQCPQHTFLLFTKRWEIAHSYSVGEEGGMDEERNPNIHLYFSASSQAEVDEAVPILLKIPVAVRGLSLEPLLEPIDLSWMFLLDPILDSIIVGCESGKDRRPCKLEWIEGIVNQCHAAGVACYVKQIDTTDLVPPGVLNNKVSTNPEEWPKCLRVQEMPK